MHHLFFPVLPQDVLVFSLSYPEQLQFKIINKSKIKVKYVYNLDLGEWTVEPS